ncbi:MAG: nucleoporin [Acidobacteriaceae bacterium]
MLLRNPRPKPANAEDGYLLLTVLVMIFLMLLALSIAAPRVAKQIQRDKEQEAVHRGLQYKRAIQLYYKKFGAYPSDIKQLENTNQIRFLRKRYKDPITGKDDWRLIHMGEAKVPPMGFFGQPLQAGMSSASTGPGLGTGSGGTPGLYANSDASGTNGSVNGAPATSGGTANGGSSSFGFSNNGSNNTSTTPNTGSSGFGFNSSTTPSTGGVGTTPNGTNGPGASSTSGGSTFGGGPIVGVGIPVKKDSLIQYHKQKKYSDWEFVYDPQEELLMNSGGGIANGGNVNGAGANGNAAGMGINGSNGSSGSSSSFGFSNSGSSGSSGSGFGSSGGSSGSGFGNFGSGPGSGPGGSSTPNAPSNPPQ